MQEVQGIGGCRRYRGVNGKGGTESNLEGGAYGNWMFE